MKQLIIFTLLVSALFANSLQGVDASFSLDVQSKLLKEFNSALISPLHTKNAYTLKKGWNKLTTPKDGVDVIKTFKNISTVKFLVTYDSVSKYWAGFTLDQSALKDIKEMLLLKYLEPHVTFYALSSKDVMLKIESSHVNATCQKIIDDKRYDVLYDSGLTKEEQVSPDKSMSFNSRYRSHEYRGVYNDTRVALMYPKMGKKSKETLKYGPAEPMVMLKYNQFYADKEFFAYDYLDKKCYKGLFPSRKMPPLPVLQELF